MLINVVLACVVALSLTENGAFAQLLSEEDPLNATDTDSVATATATSTSTTAGNNRTTEEAFPLEVEVFRPASGRNGLQASPTTSVTQTEKPQRTSKVNATKRKKKYERSANKHEPEYIVVAPRIARPSTVYRVVVGVLSGPSPVDVTAQLSSASSAETTIAPGESRELLLRVPDNPDDRGYTLKVEGKRDSVLVFRNSTFVQTAESFLTILVHLSRPIYTGDQEVGIRVILLTTELMPYNERNIEAHVLDPQGNIVKRWVSRTPQMGVVELKYQLPELPEAGWWKVLVRAGSQVEEKKFFVYKIYEPLFEVFLEMPFYGLATDEEIEGTFTGSYTTDKPIYGNVTLTLYAKQPWSRPDSEFKEVSSVFFDYVDVEEDFSFPMSSLLSVVDQLEGAEVMVEAVFHDVFTWIRAEGNSRMRILSGRVHLEVVGTEPFVFRPGMPFHAVLSVRYADGEPIDPKSLSLSSVVITATVTTTKGTTLTLPQTIIPTTSMDQQGRLETLLQMGGKAQGWVDEVNVAADEVWVGSNPVWVEKEIEELLANYSREQYFSEYRHKGIFRFHFEMPEDASTMRIDVVYSDSEHQAAATAHAYSYYSHRNQYIQVSSSTDEARVGEFSVFHVRSNFRVTKFVYLIMSKGILVHSALEVTERNDVVTISVPVSNAMAPRFTILVYVVSDQGEVIADSMSLPVRAFENMEIEMVTNLHKDHTKKTVELVITSRPGSFYSLTCQRALNFYKQHPNHLTKARVLDQISRLEPAPRSVHSVLHKSREGSFPDELLSLPSQSYGADVSATFQEAYLVVLTDAVMPLTPGKVQRCNLTMGQLDCGDGGCFYYDQQCDGIYHCKNKVDELGCTRMYEDFPRDHDVQEDPLELSSDMLFRLLRGNFLMDSFDPDDVEWCNTVYWIGHKGHEVITREIAKTVENWMIEAYAVHDEYGLTFTSKPTVFNGDPPFYILAEGPSVCRRGEQVSIRVMVFNLMETTIQAMLLIHDSPDYRFIHVESGGRVQHYSPRTSSGQHHHLLFIEGHGAKEVMIPLAIKKQSGIVEVTIDAISQMRQDSETWEVEVMPEGVPVRKHTSLMLDLENRAMVYEFLDVIVEESPIIPFSILRRFISGSPAGKISVSGGVFGPLSEDFSVDHADVFGGRHLRSTDGVAFNFGATLWSLHYLRLTNNLDIREAYPVQHLTVQLAALLWRTKQGGFCMWSSSEPSVWLTAKVVSLLNDAQHEDWENQLFIDPKIIKKSVGFMLKYQSSDGGFHEMGDMYLDSKAKKTGATSSIPLTALVVLALHSSLPSLQGDMHTRARNARQLATKFLEKEVAHLSDCYHLALTAYALISVGSVTGDKAVGLLLKKRKDFGDMSYWSLLPINVHGRRRENNQRAFLLPKEPEQYDAHAVETTSYALLFFLKREGITENTERIMRWLNAVRDWESAFISTSDSVVAMQALAEYAFRARIQDVMNMECTFEVTAQPMTPFHVTITNATPVATHNFRLENVWGHVNLVAKGSGQAVVQLDVSYGVDVLRFIEQPHKKYFDLSVTEEYHQFRNKSLITTTVCAKWIATDDGNTSHAAMVEVENPTGYIFFQPWAEKTVVSIRNESFPQLRNVHTTQSRVFWQFEYIPSHRQCFTYEIQRWYPTANLTRVRSAQVLELFAPEHFEMVMINATPLSLLDICEVCGSYQCPYCPTYSASFSIHCSNLMTFITLMVMCWICVFPM
ncbi:LOW QUALITY PROTEIN: CD109 antigen-like [Macrobrachium rosenbergii]|uniref:LOW QUALITY PROTEIN: CD109 antigen-like n=1 Tax=Macrobrachium rosenbergii TaxID=79674 RepID=UPI0034D47C2C